MIDLSVLVNLLARARVDLSSEAAAQADIEAYLRARLPGATILREHRLSPRDRPDFLVDEIVVELKSKRAAKASVAGQLERYASHDRVRAIILLTNSALGLGRPLLGKPVVEISMGRAWL